MHKTRFCVFTLGGSPVFTGFTDGSRWGRFDNVWVTGLECERMAHYFRTHCDRDTADDLSDMPENSDGLIWLGNRFAATIIST